MSALWQRMRKVGAREGLFAGVLVAVFAISGVGAGGAMASPTCPHPGSEIVGVGNSLQKNAQRKTWTPVYNLACGSESVTYVPIASNPLRYFGFTGLPVDNDFQFIATDEAPNEGQVSKSNKLSGAEAVIVPVAQTAIAVVVHPPANCQFKSGKGITWAELGAVFGGNGITEWSGFSQVEAKVAGACNAPVERVVPAKTSGATYQFKNYLSTLEGGTFGGPALPCTTEGHTKWAELRKDEGIETPNITWRQCVGATNLLRAEGGAGVVEKVASTVDTIGFASLPDVKAKGEVAVPVQNGLQGTLIRFASPENTEKSIARCESARYTLPPGAAGGIAVDWSATFGASPNIGSTEYPLCTLTFDIGFHGYESAGYTAAQGEEVADYIRNYVVPATEGQADLATAKAWYSPLPPNVQGAAEAAAEQLE